jgi:hypothetical protein
VPGEVAGQVAAHHAETGDAYLRRCLRHVLRVSSAVCVCWFGAVAW